MTIRKDSRKQKIPVLNNGFYVVGIINNKTMMVCTENKDYCHDQLIMIVRKFKELNVIPIVLNRNTFFDYELTTKDIELTSKDFLHLYSKGILV